MTLKCFTTLNWDERNEGTFWLQNFKILWHIFDLIEISVFCKKYQLSFLQTKFHKHFSFIIAQCLRNIVVVEITHWHNKWDCFTLPNIFPNLFNVCLWNSAIPKGWHFLQNLEDQLSQNICHKKLKFELKLSLSHHLTHHYKTF